MSRNLSVRVEHLESETIL